MAKIRGNTQIIDGTIGNLQIAAAAAIATSKLAEGAELLKRDGSIALTGDLNAGNHKLTGITPGTADTDAATWGQVQAVAQSLQLKDSVRVATTVASGNIDLAAGGLLIIDTIQLIAGDRVLVKNQTNAAQNGIYVAQAGAWVRSDDADGLPDPNSEVKPGMFTFVVEGSTNADTGWVLATNGTIDVGVTELTFVQFSSAGVIVAGVALTKNGQQLDVVFKEGIEVDGNALRIKLDALSGLEQSATGIKIATAGVTNSMLAGGITTDKLEDGAEFVQRDGSVAFTGDVDAGTHKVVNVVAGVAATDAVNVQQMTDAIAAIDVSSQIAPIQAEIDAIEIGAGLATDGTYVVPTGTNYLNASTSLADADSKLDVAVKANADAIAAVAAAQSGGKYFTDVVAHSVVGDSPDFGQTVLVDILPLDAAYGTVVGVQLGDLIHSTDNGVSWSIKLNAGELINVGAVLTFAIDMAQGSNWAGPAGFSESLYINQGTTTTTAGEVVVGWKALASAASVNLKASQVEVDAIETAAGLNADGTLPAYTGTNYLDAETSLRGATIALDTQVKAAHTELNAVETAAGLNDDGTLTAYTGTNYLDGINNLRGATTVLDAQLNDTNDAVALKASQIEVDAVETAVGLNADGTLAAYTGTNYIDAAASIKAATVALDAQIKTVSDTVATGASQAEVDAIETAVGLNADGTLAAYTGTNYLNAATSIKNATVLLDTQVKAVDDAKVDKTSISIDGTFATPSDVEVPSTQAVKTYLEGQVADNAVGFVDDEVPTGTIDGTNVTFTLAGVANPPAGVHLYVNGLRTAVSSVTPGASDTTIVLAAAPQVGDVISADYRI